MWLVFRLMLSPGFIDLLILWNRGLRQLGWPESARTKTPTNQEGPLPWLTYGAIDYLDQIVSVDEKVLEIGGGSSTRWWRGRGNHVTVVESDMSWFESIRGIADESHLCKTSQDVFRLLKEKAHSRKKYGVVVVDGVEPRSDYLALASRMVSDGGILVVDNSEREDYAAEMNKLGNFQRLDFFGLGPSNRYAWCTSVFFQTPPRVGGRSRLATYVTTKRLPG